MAIDENLSGLLEDCEDCIIDLSTNTETAAETTETPSKWALKGRLKSWALWVSVLGAVGIILDNLGVFARIGLDGERWTVIVNAVGGILVAFGILNDPTSRNTF